MEHMVLQSDTPLLKIPWYNFARELAGSTHPDDVVAALHALLQRLNVPAFEVALVPSPPEENVLVFDAPVRTERGVRWFLPVHGTDFVLAVELEGHSDPDFYYRTIYPFLSLAQSALYRLLTQEAWWSRLLGSLESISALMEERDILDALAKELVQCLDAREVYIFRYLQDKQAVRVEAVAQAEPGPQMVRRSQVLPADLMSGHYEVLESGQMMVFSRGGTPDLSEWEWEVLFPPQVQQALVVPFWIGTQDLGLVSVALSTRAPHVSERILRPFVRTLLHHAALAVERARLFTEVADARYELETILAETLAGILLVDKDLRVRRANEAAAAVWGYSIEQMLGQNVVDLFGKDIAEGNGYLAKAQSHLEAQGPVEWIVEARGGKRYLLLAITPLTHEHGEEMGQAEEDEHYPHPVDYRGYLFSFLDITHRKQLELLREQLLANVTHELRTPIAVIRGYAELMESQLPEDAPPLWAEALRTIEQRADDLLDMVEMHLDLAQLEADIVSPRLESVALPTLLEGVLKQVQRRFSYLPKIDVYIAPEVHEICADAHFFEQIIKHLLDNAIKFTGKKGHIWLRAWPDGKDLHLEVGDTGIGVPEEDVSHIFESFYRGRNVGYGIPGSGLGLTLVKNAVAIHGGEVEISTEEGKGTVVHLVFPGAVGACP